MSSVDILSGSRCRCARVDFSLLFMSSGAFHHGLNVRLVERRCDPPSVPQGLRGEGGAAQTAIVAFRTTKRLLHD